nr:MAG TPA_asm: hypothetical protein [Caudoviricetes sp.]
MAKKLSGFFVPFDLRPKRDVLSTHLIRFAVVRTQAADQRAPNGVCVVSRWKARGTYRHGPAF